MAAVSLKLKVFASLSGFLVDYRVGDEHSPLLLCSHALFHPDCRMRTNPVMQPLLPSSPVHWMAC